MIGWAQRAVQERPCGLAADFAAEIAAVEEAYVRGHALYPVLEVVFIHYCRKCNFNRSELVHGSVARGRGKWAAP